MGKTVEIEVRAHLWHEEQGSLPRMVFFFFESRLPDQLCLKKNPPQMF